MASTSKPNAEDSLLQARIEDAVRLCDDHSCPRFVGFLDERQQGMVRINLRKCGCEHFLFWGGYDGAERVLAGIFPSFMQPEPAAFPLDALAFTFRAGISLSHRDFLGTMLSCGLKREKLGDILCGDGLTVAYMDEDIAPFLCEQIDKVRGEGVKITPHYSGELPLAHHFEEIRDTIASPRLDAVIKVMARCSREEAARRIAAGLVSLNHVACLSVSATVKEGDVLSIRGEGRFIVDVLGPPTRKDRLFITIRKFL